VSVLTASVGLFVWNRLPVGMRRRLLLSAFSAPNGATAALLTPIATPANMMVMGPGG
jgi:di/tricarboxylate transporter